MSPSIAGIPDARAIPIERGSAIKNTTTEGGRSLMTPLSFSFSEAIPDSFCASALQLCDAAYPRPAHKSMTKSPRRSRSIGFEVACLEDNQEKRGFYGR
jgi:hypothetical protein